MKKTIQEKVDFELPAFTGRTLRAMRHGGVLLTSVSGEGKPNTMTIGWGLIGTLWAKPVFLVAVRPSRYTHQLLEQSGCFTVNVPAEGMDDVLEFCGSKSGRTVDKLTAMRLTPTAGRKVASPAIAECAIHYECKVIHKHRLRRNSLTEETKASAYPRGNYHTLYVGEILATYRDAATAATTPT